MGLKSAVSHSKVHKSCAGLRGSGGLVPKGSFVYSFCLITAHASANADVIPSPTRLPTLILHERHRYPILPQKAAHCVPVSWEQSLHPHTPRPWPLSHAVSSDRQARGYNLQSPQQHTKLTDKDPWQLDLVPKAAQIESQTRRDTMATRAESLHPGSVWLLCALLPEEAQAWLF